LFQFAANTRPLLTNPAAKAAANAPAPPVSFRKVLRAMIMDDLLSC
jgi:hypothetical protein